MEKLHQEEMKRREKIDEIAKRTMSRKKREKNAMVREKIGSGWVVNFAKGMHKPIRYLKEHKATSF